MVRVNLKCHQETGQNKKVSHRLTQDYVATTVNKNVASRSFSDILQLSKTQLASAPEERKNKKYGSSQQKEVKWAPTIGKAACRPASD